MCLGDLTQALALLPVTLDSLPIQFQRTASDGTAFELSSPHTGTDSLDDQAAFEFSDCSDDNYDSPTQRSAGVDLFSEADELYVQSVEIIQHIEEVAG